MRWPALILAILLVSITFTAGTVRAETTMTIAGTVIGTDGSPFPGVTVIIRNTTTDDIHTVTTDASGHYSHTVTPGNYSVTATYSAYRANISYGDIAQSRTNVDFTMYEVLGTVTGVVTDGNTTLAGVTVTLTGQTLTGMNASFSGVTSTPLGSYRIDNVTPGWYMVYASREGYNTSYYNRVVMLDKGIEEKIDFTLIETDIKYAKLSGTVTYNGEGLAGVKVILTPEKGADLTTVTDSGGNYSFDQVPPGEYIIYLTKDGYVTTEKKVTMEPLKGWVQDFTMKRNTLPGNSGFVLDYDLSHSMMIVGLGLSLLVTLLSLAIRHRIKANPDLLEKEPEKEDDGKPSKE